MSTLDDNSCRILCALSDEALTSKAVCLDRSISRPLHTLVTLKNRGLVEHVRFDTLLSLGELKSLGVEPFMTVWAITTKGEQALVAEVSCA